MSGLVDVLTGDDTDALVSVLEEATTGAKLP